MSELPTWGQRKIAGLPKITLTMFQVLQRLSRRDDVDYLWLPLADAHKATLDALCRNFWIFRSAGLDGVKYQITEKGREALQIYSIPPVSYRRDDLCPTCGQRPVAYSRNGRRHGYCWECARLLGRRKHKRPNGCKRVGQLCPDCGLRERHVTARGRIQTYCRVCRNEREKADRAQKHRHKLERIRAGEVIVCCRCKQQPVYHGDTYVSDYCHPCFKAYMNGYNRRRRAPDEATNT